MLALWRLGRAATVNEVREAMPEKDRKKYRTIQVYLERCAQKGYCEPLERKPRTTGRPSRAAHA